MAKKATAAAASVVEFNAALLAHIVDGTNSEIGYAFAPPDAAAALGALVLTNPNLVHTDGTSIAVVATQAGKERHAALTQLAAPSTPSWAGAATGTPSNVTALPTAAKAAKATYALDDDVPLPPKTDRVRGREASYPFDAMKVGQSFFIPATAEKPKPAATFYGTVQAANRRYAVAKPDGSTKSNRKGKVVPVTTQEREFKIYAVDETAQGRGKGARVYRIA